MFREILKWLFRDHPSQGAGIVIEKQEKEQTQDRSKFKQSKQENVIVM